MKRPSLEHLRNTNGNDFRKVLNLYNEWDKSARKKDFEECERQDRRIREIHQKHGIEES